MKKALSLLLISALLLAAGCREGGEVTPLENSKNLDIIQIATGVGWQNFLTSDGKVYASGDNNSGSLGVGDLEKREGVVKVNIPEPVKMLDNCVAVTFDNDIYIWGTQYIEDEEIKAANPQPQDYYSHPFTFISTPHKIKFGKPVKAIFNSWLYTNILSEDGEVYTFGSKYIGDGDPAIGDEFFVGKKYYPAQEPQLVNFPEKIVGISSGYSHTLALGESGKLYGYGSVEFSELGYDLRGSDDYIVVADGFEIGQFAATGHSSFFVDKNKPTVLYGTGHLIVDDVRFQETQFITFNFPSVIKELFPSNDNSLVIKDETNTLYGLGNFYQDFFDISGVWREPKLVKSDIEISSIIRYSDVIYYTDTDGRFAYYDAEARLTTQLTIDS